MLSLLVFVCIRIFTESIPQLFASYVYDYTKTNFHIRDGYLFTQNGKGKTEIGGED